MHLYFGFLALSIGLAVALAAIGSAFGLGRAVGAAMEGISRQPEAAGAIQGAMIIGAALIEALTIYALVIAIMLWIKLPGAPQVLEALEKMAK